MVHGQEHICLMVTEMVKAQNSVFLLEYLFLSSNDAPFDGWQCVQLKSQRELCHDYIRRPLKKPIVVNVKYGCEPRPNLGYRKDNFDGNRQKHHHHRHHHHDRRLQHQQGIISASE